MIFNRAKSLEGLDKYHETTLDCSVSKASNEIMLHRISEGKDIEFPFCSIGKEK